MVLGRCWWSQTSLKCPHGLAIVVIRASLNIVYETRCHNHATFRVSLLPSFRIFWKIHILHILSEPNLKEWFIRHYLEPAIPKPPA